MDAARIRSTYAQLRKLADDSIDRSQTLRPSALDAAAKLDLETLLLESAWMLLRRQPSGFRTPEEDSSQQVPDLGDPR